MEYMRVVEKEEGEAFAQKRGLMFMETSSYNGNNVHNAFMISAEKLYRGILEGIIDICKVSCKISYFEISYS